MKLALVLLLVATTTVVVSPTEMMDDNTIMMEDAHRGTVKIEVLSGDTNANIKKYDLFSDGPVCGGFVVIRGSHERRDDDYIPLATTYKSCIEFSTIWGGNMGRVCREWVDGFGANHAKLGEMSDGEKLDSVKVMCNDRTCGPDLGGGVFQVLMQNLQVAYHDGTLNFYRRGGGIIPLAKATTENWNQYAAVTSLEANFNIAAKVNCPDAKTTVDVLSVVEKASNTASSSGTTKVTIQNVETLSSTSSTTAEWFLKASIGSSSSLSLTAKAPPVNGVEVGGSATRALNFAAEASEKITKVDSKTTTVQKTLTTEETVVAACAAGQTLLQIKERVCRSFDLQNCKPFDTIDPDYKNVKFEAAPMENCMTTEKWGCKDGEARPRFAEAANAKAKAKAGGKAKASAADGTSARAGGSGRGKMRKRSIKLTKYVKPAKLAGKPLQGAFQKNMMKLRGTKAAKRGAMAASLLGKKAFDELKARIKKLPKNMLDLSAKSTKSQKAATKSALGVRGK